MSLYRRGNVWWYKFKFNGQEIRESSKSESKQIAIDAEKARRRKLEQSFNGIVERKRPPLFAAAAKSWIAEKENLAAKTKGGYKDRLKPVEEAFGKLIVSDISVTDVVEYRTARLAKELSPRTVNCEIACLRGVLKLYGLWSPIAERIKRLRENHDVGRALSAEDERKLLAACAASHAPSLLPLFIFARDTGLRAAEVKSLRRRDLKLEMKKGIVISGEVVVPRSKTEAGTGRSVPLTQDACSSLSLWLSRFEAAGLDSYVFPRHEVQMLKGGKESKICNVDLTKPVQSWQRAWRTALSEAGVHYRWHDLRHSFVSRLAENPGVSEQTIRALAGHVSKQMMERYSHIRVEAKQEAIRSLQNSRPAREGVQKWAQ